MTNKKKTCGDHGGTTQKGQPCTRPKGWGRNTNTGKCKAHHGLKNEQLKREYLKMLRNEIISYAEAARKINRSRTTVWNWQQADPEFDEKVKQAQKNQDDHRVKAVEDSLFKRLIKGDAAASETIFFLKNRRPDRWRDTPETQINVSQTQKQEIDNKELITLLREAYRERKKKEKKKKEDEGEAELKVKPIR